MNTIEIGLSSAEAVAGLLSLVGAKGPMLDTTYGNGKFWDEQPQSGQLISADRNISRVIGLNLPSLCASFFSLPFADSSVPTVIFDPPFHPDVGSAEIARFSSMGQDEKELKLRFEDGVRECWRVCSHHLVVKCQHYIHNHAPQWMPLWAIGICGEPFEWLTVMRKNKRVSGRWIASKSLRRNHADYLLFSRAGNKR